MVLRIFLLIIIFLITGFAPANAQAFSGEQADTLLSGGLGRNSSILMPMFFYQEETSFGGGICGGYYFTEQRVNRISNVQWVALYTAKHQFKVSVLPKIYTSNQQAYYSGHLRWSHYPDKFFGIGRGTPDSLEENFTSRSLSVLLQRQWVISTELMLGVQAAADYSTMVEFDPNGYLQSSGISGTDRYFSSGLGVLGTWDSRNNNFYATQGQFYKVSVLMRSSVLGGELDYTRVTTDLRNFFPLGNQHAIGVQVYGDFSWGDTPFQEMPSVGGNEILRGYYQGRYRDKMMLSAQAEYRYPLYWRLKGALFVSAADVAPKLSKFSLKETRFSFGTGLRFRVNPTNMNIRFDVGVTQDLKPAVYFTAMEAF